jgi:hypothetical protein
VFRLLADDRVAVLRRRWLRERLLLGTVDTPLCFPTVRPGRLVRGEKALIAIKADGIPADTTAGLNRPAPRCAARRTTKGGTRRLLPSQSHSRPRATTRPNARLLWHPGIKAEPRSMRHYPTSAEISS